MGDVDPVAVTALIISLVALLATCGQLLQQYFGTADGYRRCQPSVMGVWGKKTKLKWHWSEFRFETIYFVPRISVQPLKRRFVGWRPDWLDGGQPPKGPASEPDLYMIYGISGSSNHWWQSGDYHRWINTDGGESVCWVPMLKRLHIAQRNDDIYGLVEHPSITREHDQVIIAPCVQVERRSWDFMVGHSPLIFFYASLTNISRLM
jgi:hypothetical protein